MILPPSDSGGLSADPKGGKQRVRVFICTLQVVGEGLGGGSQALVDPPKSPPSPGSEPRWHHQQVEPRAWSSLGLCLVQVGPHAWSVQAQPHAWSRLGPMPDPG